MEHESWLKPSAQLIFINQYDGASKSARNTIYLSHGVIDAFLVKCILQNNGRWLLIKKLQFDHVSESRRQFAQLIKIATCDNLATREFIYTVAFNDSR